MSGLTLVDVEDGAECVHRPPVDAKPHGAGSLTANDAHSLCRDSSLDLKHGLDVIELSIETLPAVLQSIFAR